MKLAFVVVAIAAFAGGALLASRLNDIVDQHEKFRRQCEALEGIALFHHGGEWLCLSKKGVVLRGP